MKNNGNNKGRSGLCAMICILIAATCATALGDRIVLKNGAFYNGKLLSRTDSVVKFRVILVNGAEIELNFPADKVRDVTVGDAEPDGGEPAKPKPKPKPPIDKPTKKPTPDKTEPTEPKPPATTGAKPIQRSSSAVKSLIAKTGKTLPDWWDSVKLDYPRTLDLSGRRRAQGWQPRINLGAYFFSLVTPHPKRWKSGIKLLHHVVDVRKNDKLMGAQAMGMLGNYYQRYVEDQVRAAYWKQRTLLSTTRPTVNDVVGLAECYWRLGNKAMASALLKKWGLDTRPIGASIKLWAEIGQPDRAMKLATAMARMSPQSGYVYAGNLHRLAGRYDQAIACYDKSLAINNPRGHGKLYRRRAQECGYAVRLLKSLDIAKVPDGTHSGMSMSYRGPLHVAVKVADGRITSAKVTNHKDDIFFMSIENIPQLIVDKQSVEKIDAVSGATVTCEAILNAATKALAKAGK